MSTAICVGGLIVFLSVPELRGIVLNMTSATAFVWNGTANFVVALLLSQLALESVYVRSARRDRLIGNLSYVVYRSHWLAVMLAARYLGGVGVLIKLPVVAGLLVLTYAVSLLVLLFFDQPISVWRERWIERQLVSNRAAISRA